jgi:hypothetical protein
VLVLVRLCVHVCPSTLVLLVWFPTWCINIKSKVTRLGRPALFRSSALRRGPKTISSLSVSFALLAGRPIGSGGSIASDGGE